MTVARLLADLDSYELTEWCEFLKAKAERDKEQAKRAKEDQKMGV